MSHAARLEAMRRLRFVWAYPAYGPERMREEEAFCARIRHLGFDVQGFPLPCRGGWWPFPRLDERWRARDRELLGTYERLGDILAEADVLIAAGGAMLHPEFVATLPAFRVFLCADDPESSEVLSRPVAPSFDFAFPQNIACVDLYRSWGCPRVEWLCHGVRPELCDPGLTADHIRNGGRDLDVVLFCERVHGLSDRGERVERLRRHFPQALVRGPGWPDGPIDGRARRAALARAKIGWNLHHSIGPCNTRTFTLPANGILQICDNAEHLGRIFRLDEEVVGFTTLEECIEKTRYYLEHDEERRHIAAAGFERVLRDYTEERQWERLVLAIADPCLARRQPAAAAPSPAPDDRPRLLLLADRPGWAYDREAQAMRRHLGDRFDIEIAYVCEEPDLSARRFDLVWVFFWGETWHRRFVDDPRRIIKEVASHRWAESDYGCLTPAELVARHLADAGTVAAISQRLCDLIAPYRDVHHVPQGIDAPDEDPPARRGPLTIGWAGNAADPCKGLVEVLQPAAGDDFALHVAGGELDRAAMDAFYDDIDVLCVASTHEGGPLPLLEGMAHACFPVTVDVGIAPEVVKSGENGLVVRRSPEAFRAAFAWCAANAEAVRETARRSARDLRASRSWSAVMHHREAVIRTALASCPPRQPTPPAPHDGYAAHLATVNPGGISDGAYAAACFYYEHEILPLMPRGREARILELGCGFGHLLRFLSERDFRHLLGVDRDRDLLALARQHAGPAVELIAADAREFLRATKARFDVVLALDLIEHFDLASARELAELVHAALVPGGRAVFRTPNMANVLAAYSRYMDLTHAGGFTEQSLQHLLQLAGFATTDLHLPEWNASHPLGRGFEDNRDFHARLFTAQDRSMPRCFDKNLVVWAERAGGPA